MPANELCRSGGFCDATFYKSRAKYGGAEVTGLELTLQTPE